MEITNEANHAKNTKSIISSTEKCPLMSQNMKECETIRDTNEREKRISSCRCDILKIRKILLHYEIPCCDGLRCLARDLLYDKTIPDEKNIIPLSLADKIIVTCAESKPLNDESLLLIDKRFKQVSEEIKEIINSAKKHVTA